MRYYVFADLAAGQHDGLRYASFQLDDGVSFVHVAVLDDGARNTLLHSAAFARFSVRYQGQMRRRSGRIRRDGDRLLSGPASLTARGQAGRPWEGGPEGEGAAMQNRCPSGSARTVHWFSPGWKSGLVAPSASNSLVATSTSVTAKSR